MKGSSRLFKESGGPRQPCRPPPAAAVIFFFLCSKKRFKTNEKSVFPPPSLVGSSFFRATPPSLPPSSSSLSSLCKLYITYTMTLLSLEVIYYIYYDPTNTMTQLLCSTLYDASTMLYSLVFLPLNLSSTNALLCFASYILHIV